MEIAKSLDRASELFTQRAIYGLNIFKSNKSHAPDGVARILEFASESEYSGVSVGRGYFSCEWRHELLDRINGIGPLLDMGVKHFDSKYYPPYEDANVLRPLDRPG